VTGFLGLGSNVGDARGHLQAAVAGLRARSVAVPASSSVYETDPVGDVLDQPAFLNACLRVETDLDPEALLDACKAVERDRGRTLAGEAGYVRHGPRPLDVDILVFGNEPYRSPRLTVPHAALAERRFVLVPLAEVAPGLEVPGRGPVETLLAALD
jgi:2-amino-4-hydroxy-6-hydroxymethyldihydropteridine diphosphokinase